MHRKALVTFQNGIWPDREVPCVHVRPRPAGGRQPALQPGGDVEVMVDASDKHPMGWARGVFAGGPRSDGSLLVHIGQKEYAVGLAALRPVSSEPVLDPMVIIRRAVPVPTDLHEWLTTQDAEGCLEMVRVSAGLGLAGAGSATGGILRPHGGGAQDTSLDALDGLPDAVILLGSEEATRRGEMLLRVHLMHQQAVETYHARRARKLEVLKAIYARAQGPDGAARASFQVDAALVGRTCGKGGERMKRIGGEYGVEIRIIDGSEDAAPRTVIIMGADDDSVLKAREELELVKTEYPIDAERVAWCLREVSSISKSAGLAYNKWIDETRTLELYGSRQQVEEAILLLDNHSEYFTVFEEMTRQREEIQRSFEALDEAAAAVGLAPPAGARRPPQRGGGASGRPRQRKPRSDEGEGDDGAGEATRQGQRRQQGSAPECSDGADDAAVPSGPPSSGGRGRGAAPGRGRGRAQGRAQQQ